MSSAKRRNTTSGGWPADSRANSARTCGRMHGGQVSVVAPIAPTVDCRPATRRGRSPPTTPALRVRSTPTSSPPRRRATAHGPSRRGTPTTAATGSSRTPPRRAGRRRARRATGHGVTSVEPTSAGGVVAQPGPHEREAGDERGRAQRNDQRVRAHVATSASLGTNSASLIPASRSRRTWRCSQRGALGEAAAVVHRPHLGRAHATVLAATADLEDRRHPALRRDRHRRLRTRSMWTTKSMVSEISDHTAYSGSLVLLLAT